MKENNKGFKENNEGQEKAKLWHKSKDGIINHKKNALKQWNKKNRKKREIKKICIYCNKEFIAYFERTRFCSRNCIMAEYRRTHPELKIYQKKYLKTYIMTEKTKKNRKNYIREYCKNKFDTDKDYNITKRLRGSVYFALTHYTKTGKILKSKQMGINYKKIIKHLKPFPSDISLYHIDHIKPLCRFDLTKKEEIIKAFAPENHQWLLAHDNQSKGKKYPIVT